MTIFVTVLHCLVCFMLIVLVLLQKGKGAEIGAVFGGASATTIFGSAGAGTFLTKLTTWSAVVFMVTSFYLAYVALNADSGSTFAAPPAAAETQAATPAAQQAPAADFVEVMDEAPPAGAAASAPAGDAGSAPPVAPAAAPDESAPARP
jgi:preprotein translocase subunit SecG